MGKLLVTTGSLPIDPGSLSTLSAHHCCRCSVGCNPALLLLKLCSPAGAADGGGHFVLRKKKKKVMISSPGLLLSRLLFQIQPNIFFHSINGLHRITGRNKKLIYVFVYVLRDLWKED